MEFKKVMADLMNGNKLSESSAYSLMKNIGDGVYNDSQKSALIISLSSRELMVEEIGGFRNALLDLSVKTELENYEAIDLCGTGGDGKDTFNISTLASLIVAGAGYKVIKHGNYGVSSISGSSNVLEYLGYTFSNDPIKNESELNKLNICLLHAPLFHPALKSVGFIRKELGIKTIFNSLGPLVNPAKTKYQMVGVFNLKLARIYNYFFQTEGKNFSIVYSTDGYDEISLTDKVQMYSEEGENLFEVVDFGFEKIQASAIRGGESVKESAKIFSNILSGKGTEQQNNVVLANAAVAINCFDRGKGYADCLLEAQESLNSRRAESIFYKLINR